MEVQYRKEYSPALGRDMECQDLWTQGQTGALYPVSGWAVF